MNSASTSELLTVGGRPEAHTEAAENDGTYFGPRAMVPWHVHWIISDCINVVCLGEYDIAGPKKLVQERKLRPQEALTEWSPSEFLSDTVRSGHYPVWISITANMCI